MLHNDIRSSEIKKIVASAGGCFSPASGRPGNNEFFNRNAIPEKKSNNEFFNRNGIPEEKKTNNCSLKKMDIPEKWERFGRRRRNFCMILNTKHNRNERILKDFQRIQRLKT